MRAMFKLEKLKLTSLKITLIVLLLTGANMTVLAQQEDGKTTPTQETPAAKAESKLESKSESKSKQKNESAPKAKTTPIPLPTPLAQQQKDDLTHYLPANKVSSLLAGPDDYITLVDENISENNKGVAILLPDWQQSAANPKAINFLRNKLPLQGWTTIAIQPANKPENYPSTALKVSEQQQENKTIIDAYKIKFNAMINAVINKSKEYPGIVIVIAQGNHAAMLVDFFDQQSSNQSSNQNSAIPNAVILLSSYLLTSNDLIDEAHTALAKKIAYSEYPVLDLYLNYDHPIVLAKTKQRLALSKQEMKVYYRQRQLNSPATGYYPEQELLTQINSWLKSIGW